MRFSRTFAAALILSSIPAISVAQTKNNTGKVGYSRLAGKGTPADLSRHNKDYSALVLRESTNKGASADLNRIEQQSLHSQTATSKQVRIRPTGVPKLGAKTDKSDAINFSGRAQNRNLTTTRSTGKSSGSTPAKPH